MTHDELVSRYPLLYHMATLGSWSSIRRHGLRSTTALLDLFRVPAEERSLIETQHRRNSVRISHPEYGVAEVRDQLPMDDRGLQRALHDGLTPTEWYRILNGRVFFWVQEHRLEGMLGARAYRGAEHTVLTLDTTALINVHAERVRLSPMNTGATKPFPFPRGQNTFRAIADYPFEERRRTAGVKNAVVEFTVEYAVPDVEDFVLRVERRQAGKHPIVEWERP